MCVQMHGFNPTWRIQKQYWTATNEHNKKMNTASLFRQQSTAVLLLHTVYLTIWYISKKWVFYQFVQRFHLLFLIFIVFCLISWFTIGEKDNPQIQVFVRGTRVDILFSLGSISNVPFHSSQLMCKLKMMGRH